MNSLLSDQRKKESGQFTIFKKKKQRKNRKQKFFS